MVKIELNQKDILEIIKEKFDINKNAKVKIDEEYNIKIEYEYQSIRLASIGDLEEEMTDKEYQDLMNENQKQNEGDIEDEN